MQGAGCRGLRLRVYDLGLTVQGFRIQGSDLEFGGLGFKAQGSGFTGVELRVYGFGLGLYSVGSMPWHVVQRFGVRSAGF